MIYNFNMPVTYIMLYITMSYFILNNTIPICLSNSCPFAQATKMIKFILGPKYDGKYLHSLLKEKLGNTRLGHALTNVVIPTFDIKQLQPTIFSSYEVWKLIQSNENGLSNSSHKQKRTNIMCIDALIR
jgi:hypothetical protein